MHLVLIIILSLQLYERRQKVLKSEKERKLWESIDYNFMTEESDGGDDIRQHSLPWRSEGTVTSDVWPCKLDTYQWCIERGQATAHRPM